MKKSNSYIVILFVLVATKWLHHASVNEDLSGLERHNMSVITNEETKKFSLSEDVVFIKIFSQTKLQSFTFSSESGIYTLWNDGVEIFNTSKFPIIKFT